MSTQVDVTISGDFPPEARNLAEHLLRVVKETLEQARATGRCEVVQVHAWERFITEQDRNVFSDDPFPTPAPHREFRLMGYYYVPWPDTASSPIKEEV